MTYYDKLDLILKYFHDRKSTAFESREEAWGNLHTHFTFDEFKMLLEHLCDKWFIMSDSVECRNNQFKISLKGIEFYEDGGFKAKKCRLIRDKWFGYAKSIGTFLGGVGIFAFTAIQAYTGWLSVNKPDTKQEQQTPIPGQSVLSETDSVVQPIILPNSSKTTTVLDTPKVRN